jgi:hypothetical protein
VTGSRHAHSPIISTFCFEKRGAWLQDETRSGFFRLKDKCKARLLGKTAAKH